MASATTQKQGAWYHFRESNYLTWFTDWLLKFGGKGAHSILILTTLYMSAQLFPGVNLPPTLNLAVFLLQMFMLDVGGLGLATLARQAREHGNTDGAKYAGRLSRFLIGIMIAGIVTVCVEQAISNFHLTEDAQNWIDAIKIIIEVSLVVARAFCAVLYGVAIHSLEGVSGHSNTPAQLPDYTAIIQQNLAEMRTQIQTEMQQSLSSFRVEIGSQIDSKIVAAEPMNYDAIVRKMMPVIEAKLSGLETTFSAQIPQTADMAALALELAPMLLSTEQSPNALANDESVLLSEQIEDDEVNEKPRITDKLPELQSEQPANVQRLHLVNKSVRTQRTTENSEAAKKIKRLLRKDPTLGPTELASKCSCSKSYASTVKRTFLAEQLA